MQFNINTWKNTYNKVQVLGKQLKDSMPDWHGNPAISPLDKEGRDILRDAIKTLLEKNNRYLDQCGMRMAAPLWIYKYKDPKTWPSDESFAYKGFLVS